MQKVLYAEFTVKPGGADYGAAFDAELRELT
jgi:hypothetical protein